MFNSLARVTNRVFISFVTSLPPQFEVGVFVTVHQHSGVCCWACVGPQTWTVVDILPTWSVTGWSFSYSLAMSKEQLTWAAPSVSMLLLLFFLEIVRSEWIEWLLHGTVILCPGVEYLIIYRINSTIFQWYMMQKYQSDSAVQQYRWTNGWSLFLW